MVTAVDSKAGSEADVVKEADIIRDLIFVFQGIQGVNILYSNNEDAFTLRHNLVVSHSTRKIVNELCELGWLYRKVNNWMRDQQQANV